MLQTKYYRAFDMVFAFISAFFDRCRNELHSAPLTSVFTLYTALPFIAIQYNYCTKRKKQRRSTICIQDCSFKDLVASILGPHHLSSLGTLKFRLPDHIVENIRRFGGLQFNDEGIYKHAHLLFKTHRGQMSKRRFSSHRETINAVDRSNHTILYNFVPSLSSISFPSFSSSPPARKPGLVCYGKHDLFSELITAEKYLCSNPHSHLISHRVLFCSDPISIISNIETDSLLSLVNLSLENLSVNPDSSTLTKTRLTLVSSSSIVVGYIPTLDN